MQRLKPHQIDTTGADATKDTPRFNPATGRLEYQSGGARTIFVPLTSSLNGVPDLVWDADDTLVLTEVPR